VAAAVLAKVSVERGDDDGAREWLGRLPPDLAASSNHQNASIGSIAEALRSFLDNRLLDGIDISVRHSEELLVDRRWPSLVIVLDEDRAADAFGEARRGTERGADGESRLSAGRLRHLARRVRPSRGRSPRRSRSRHGAVADDDGGYLRLSRRGLPGTL
jgi:hypothetical protein